MHMFGKICEEIVRMNEPGLRSWCRRWLLDRSQWMCSRKQRPIPSNT